MAGKEQGSLRSVPKPPSPSPSFRATSPARTVSPPPPTRSSSPPSTRSASPPPTRSSSPPPRNEEDVKSELKSVKNELARAREEICKLKDQLAKQQTTTRSDRKEAEDTPSNVSYQTSGTQRLYVNNFKSNFFAVEAQAQVGLKTNTSLVAYLNKEFGGDGMTNFLVALGELHSQLGQSAATAAHSAQLMGSAIEKLQSENTNINQRLQGIGEQHKIAVKNVLPLFQTRQQIIEKYAEWQVYNYKKDITKAWDRKQTVENSLTKFEALQANPQTKEAMNVYESAIQPLLGMMEEVEDSRLHALQTCLSDLCACSCVMGPWTGSLVETIKELNKNASIKEFVAKQSTFQVPHVLTWKQDLSADFLTFQKPATDNHIGRKLSISLSNTLRQRKPSLSPSRRPTIEAPTATPGPPSPSAAIHITDVIECSMMTPIILEAVRDYAGSGADSDLIFQAGDLIKLLSPLGVDWSHGVVWCTGRDLSSGAQGRFPSNYVTPCKLR